MRTSIWRLGALVCLMSSCSAAFAADADDPSVKRGAYIATASDCVACHTAPGGKPFAGGLAIASPVGVIYATNITPSKTAGIGRYTEVQFAQAVRAGVRADGANLYPAMPYTSYRLLTDADIHDLFGFLQHGVDPVDAAPKRTALPFPMNIRLSMMAWNLLFAGGGPFKADPERPLEWNRGKYLADGAAHCSACHSPRGFLMEELSGRYLGGAQVDGWNAPNITSDKTSGIGSWSQDELASYLSTGALSGKAQAAGSMGEAVQHSFSHLTKEDIAAIAAYIATVPPLHDAPDGGSRFSYGEPFSRLASLRGASSIRSDTDKDASGAELFYGNCASCHQASGQGSKDNYYPSLFHNSATGAVDHGDLIAAILNGVDRSTPKGEAFMPGFGGKVNDVGDLNDSQIAKLANYLLDHYGRAGAPVTASDVAESRSGGPASSLVLLARIGLAVGAAVGLLVLALLVIWGRQRLWAS